MCNVHQGHNQYRSCEAATSWRRTIGVPRADGNIQKTELRKTWLVKPEHEVKLIRTEMSTIS